MASGRAATDNWPNEPRKLENAIRIGLVASLTVAALNLCTPSEAPARRDVTVNAVLEGGPLMLPWHPGRGLRLVPPYEVPDADHVPEPLHYPPPAATYVVAATATSNANGPMFAAQDVGRCYWLPLDTSGTVV